MASGKYPWIDRGTCLSTQGNITSQIDREISPYRQGNYPGRKFPIHTGKYNFQHRQGNYPGRNFPVDTGNIFLTKVMHVRVLSTFPVHTGKFPYMYKEISLCKWKISPSIQGKVSNIQQKKYLIFPRRLK